MCWRKLGVTSICLPLMIICMVCLLFQMEQFPTSNSISPPLKFSKGGNPPCSTCRDGQGHGPYSYAYWGEGSRLRSEYIGKAPLEAETCLEVVTASSTATRSGW